MKKIELIIFIALVLGGLSYYFFTKQNPVSTVQQTLEQKISEFNPLSIEAMRKRDYPGSELKIEETLESGSSYDQYIASYFSDGFKIYGLLTVPSRDPSRAERGQDDNKKYPVIIFNHGYIPPEQYQTSERYGSYVDGFARAGYIVFKPDYRGHGESEGNPEGAYYSPSYTVDVLNAVSALKKYKEADPERIGMWGHSMGGNITLRAMVVSKEIKAGVIWAGVVGTYEDMMTGWRRSTPWQPSQREQATRRVNRQKFIDKYGSPSASSPFWQSISPYTYLADISGPLQLHHGTADTEVPEEFSEHLYEELQQKAKVVEYYTYSGADHNLSGPFSQAMRKSVEFFDRYLK